MAKGSSREAGRNDDSIVRGEKLVELATQFAHSGSAEAAGKFVKEWQSIVVADRAAGPGKNYLGQVESATVKVAKASLSPFMPAASIKHDEGGGYIDFEP